MKTVAFRIVLQGQEIVIRNTQELRKALADIRKELATAEFGGQKFNELSQAQAKLLNVQGRLQQQTRQTRNELKASGRDAEIAKGSYEELSARLSVLTARWLQMGSEARNSLQGRTLEREIKGVSNELSGLDAKIGRFQHNVGNYVSAFDSLRFRFTDFIKGGFIIAGVNAIIQGFEQLARTVIPVNAQVSDSLADIQRVAGLTTIQAEALLNTLKGLDTRTSLQDLLQFAVIGGKLGVPARELGEFTSALDSLKVALGGELGGDVEEVANKLGKLNNVFDVTGATTGERLLKIGNAIVDLANRGVATGEFLSDFGERLAGIAEISGITLGQVLGLGAGFEELGQTAEVSSTAVNQAILLIGKDLDNVAKITGISRNELRKLFADNPAEALIRVSQALTGNAAGLEQISKAFGEFGSDGRRAVAVLGVLGKNADFFREKIAFANAALEDTGEITTAVALKQNTLAASIEKLKNAFIELVQGPNITGFFKNIFDAATSVLTAIGRIEDKLPGLGRAFVNTLSPIAPFFTGASKDITTLFTKFQDNKKAIDAIEASVPKLLSRYGELNSLTKLTNEQQAEFKNILSEIGNLFPGAITRFDEQGRAAAFSKDKVLELADAQQKLTDITKGELVSAVNAEIKVLEKKIALNDKEIEAINAKKVTAENSAKITRELQNELEARKQNEERIRTLRALLEEANSTTNDYEKATKDATVATDDFSNSIAFQDGKVKLVAGSIAFLKDQISKLQAELENVVDPSQYTRIFQEVLKVQEKLAAKEREFENARITSAGGSLIPDPLPQLQDIDAAVTDLLNNVGINFFDAESARVESLQQALAEFDAAVQKSNKKQIELNAEKNEKLKEQEREKNKQVLSEIASTLGEIGQLFSAVAEIQRTATQNRIRDLQRVYNREIELAEDNTDLQAELRQRLDEQVEQIEREAFERQKRLQIAQAVISGAQAIVSTLAALPGPTDIISLGTLRALQIALVAATTAAQIAAISSQGFEQGKESSAVGYTGHGSTKEVAGVVHRDEEVIPSRTLHHPKAAGHVMELRKISRALGYRSAKPGGFETGRPSPLLAQSPVSNSILLANNLSASPQLIQAIQQAVAQGSAAGTRAGAMDGAIEAQRVRNRDRILAAKTKV